MKVYGIHFGSLYDGGSTLDIIFKDKQKAIDECLFLVEEKREEHEKAFGSNSLEFDEEYYTDFQWRKDDTMENFWSNNSDCIFLQEFEFSE